MNRRQTIEVLTKLEAAYPKGLSGKTDKQRMDLVQLWSEMFESDAVEDVMAGVNRYIADPDSRFFPSVGEIRARMRSTERARAPVTAEMLVGNVRAWAIINGLEMPAGMTPHEATEWRRAQPVCARKSPSPETARLRN